MGGERGRRDLRSEPCPVHHRNTTASFAGDATTSDVPSQLRHHRRCGSPRLPLIPRTPTPTSAGSIASKSTKKPTTRLMTDWGSGGPISCAAITGMASPNSEVVKSVLFLRNPTDRKVVAEASQMLHTPPPRDSYRFSCADECKGPSTKRKPLLGPVEVVLSRVGRSS
ncbi:hypothetical protein U1Q18_018417 [Sarracenia purpurea var. burkii]